MRDSANTTCLGTLTLFFSIDQKMRLSYRMAINHLCVFRKLTATYRDVCVNSNRFETQTFEESESQNGICSQNLSYEHLLVMNLENLNNEV